MSEAAGSSRQDLQRIARQAMRDRGFEPDFDAAVLAELGTVSGPATSTEPTIRDLRQLLWASIDNDDSLDLDQLSVAERVGDGLVKVFVAVADVAALVTPTSAINAHAQHNTTSVYTPAQVFPMLPERLSTDLTSLGEGQDRQAIVIEMVVDPDGTVLRSDLYRAHVHNRAKLAYPSVGAWLDGRGPIPPKVAAVSGLEGQLRLQDGVARALKTRRAHHGALTLQTLESRPVFEGGVLTDLRPEEPNAAKALIEDLMIAANGVVASYLDTEGVPGLRRILRVPERWDRIVALAAGLGEPLPAVPDAAALEAFLGRRRQVDPLRFPDLSLSIVKLLGSGEYVVTVPGQARAGHFGLAVTAYTHSTAPNRRFPDLVTQRLLKAAMAGTPAPYGMTELQGLAHHCTEQEENAKKVERQVQKSAAVLLLARRVGERFDGIVTGASDKGTWVRIFRPPVEGKMVRGFQGLDVGDRVRVELLRTNVERGFIDFAHAQGSP
jgi:exoribonuclease-2